MVANVERGFAVTKLWLVLVLMASALLLACGGDDDKSGGSTRSATATADGNASATATTKASATAGADGDYYSQIADLLNQADRDSNDIALQYGGPYDDTADEISQTSSAFTQTGQVLETVALSLNELDPPSEADDAHTAYISSIGSLAAIFSQAIDDLENVSTNTELDAFKDQYGTQLDNANADLESNCVVLQGLADSAGSTADLGCTVQN